MTLTTARVQFIVPKEATNLVTNPSFEGATTGYTAFGAGVSIAKVSTQSRRGIASCEVTTATNVASGLYYAIALTNAVQYSFSADILDVAGQTFNLFIASATDGTLASTNTTWTGTGYWKRRSVTWTATSGATFYLFITRSSVASTTKFFVDGVQLETGAESTYLDGDMVGFVSGETAYRWNGVSHASTSWRSGQTRSGGSYVNLSTYARLLTIIGLGMSPVTNIAVPSSMGGSYYQNSIINERPFSLLININGSDYATIQRSREAIATCLKPDKTIYRQPLLIQYDALDGTGLELAETLMIPCLYEGGMEGETQGNNERVSLNFKMFLPTIRQQGEKGQALGFQTTVADADYILMRTNAGVWQAMAGGTNNGVFAIAINNYSSMYVGGLFTNLGDANGDYISQWNGTAWSSLGSGMNDLVRALVISPDGTLYAGGNFTLAGGVANTVNIAKWNGSVWAPLSTGAGGVVRALVFGPDGNLYVGGDFTNLGDANGDYIVKWTGSAWVSLGTGMNGAVYALAVGPDGSLYAGGAFTSAGGVTGTAKIAKWNGTAWSALEAGASDTVLALALGLDGTLYAGGVFTNLGDANGDNIAQWDGNVWRSLGGGVDSGVTSLFVDKKNGNLYIGGTFSKAGGITLPESLAAWNGTTWRPLDVDLPGTPDISAIIKDSGDNLYVGFNTTGSATSATVTIPSVGNATTYPRFTLTGPGAISQIKDYTTGKAIYFNLTLAAGEVATLNLDPTNMYFMSGFRGNLLNTILPGSDLNFELLPGSNNISAYYYTGTTAASAIQITWQDGYHSIDGAVR